jgi:Zn-dependent protease
VSSKLEIFLVLLPVFIVSLTLHEMAHGWSAYRLGDPTAKLLGRLSPNPLVHLDPLGTAMFGLTYWIGGFLFGWAKPVPINPYNLRGNPQRGMALVAAAGPATNFLLAIAFGAALVHGSYGELTTDVLVYSFYVNVVLGVFNLLPIPPLDGSRIIGAFMSPSTYARWSELDQYGMVAILLLFFFFQRQFTLLLSGAIDQVASAISLLVGGTPVV